ncbi:MAG: hypothetical protein DMG57_26440 [Acidobacteria bacterium]|nr:MAG: hypothetical protein DMG57_26440 [Acidobacteriota bacterium]
MKCDEVTKAIPYYYYGELPPDTEDAVEQHLVDCPPCQQECERQRALAVALDAAEVEAPPYLLSQCRHELARAIYREETPAVHHASTDHWRWFREALGSLRLGIRFRQPVGALTLVALGFFAARFVGIWPGTASLASAIPDGIVSSIHSIQPDHQGRVQISLDETRRRVVSGRLDDQNIQRLLLVATREQDNPGVRVESVELLKDRGGSSEIRSALVASVMHDPNPGVRLKALEGLKDFSSDGEVRKLLAQVLLKDENSGVRIQAIDLLVKHQDSTTVGVLQSLVNREENSYIRMQCQNALQAMNASVGTY